MPPSSSTSIVKVATEFATVRRQCRYRDGCVSKLTGSRAGSEIVVAGSAMWSSMEVVRMQYSALLFQFALFVKSQRVMDVISRDWASRILPFYRPMHYSAQRDGTGVHQTVRAHWHMDLCEIDSASTPPALRIPDRFNAAYDLLERNLRAGRAPKIACIDDVGSYSYGELARRVNRFAGSLHRLGMHMEQRAMLCRQDGIDSPTAFLSAIKTGIVPIPVNAMLSPADYAYMLHDSRAAMLVISEPLLPQFLPILRQSPFLKHVVVSGTAQPPPGMRSFD